MIKEKHFKEYKISKVLCSIWISQEEYIKEGWKMQIVPLKIKLRAIYIK